MGIDMLEAEVRKILGKDEDPTKHNYMKKLAKITKLMDVGNGMFRADVNHEDECSMFDDEHCDCDPDIKITEDTSDADTSK